MSAQRAGSAVEVDHRSIHPNIPGVPWYAALLIAITATAIGYGIDAGQKELTHVFAGFYIAGCVVAVLAVRQDGVFTAIIQPPLILFCAVPGSYWLFHGGKVGNVKDLLINCGYPLIERFPLMLGTAGGVLLIGLFRWYFGMSHRPAVTTDSPEDAGAAPTAEPNSAIGAIAAKLNSLLRLTSHGDDPDDAASTDSKRTRAHSPRPKATARNGRAARGGGSAARPDRARAAPRGFDPADPPRRRPRPQGDPDLRTQRPRDDRREPRGRGNPYERPAPRGSRFDSYDTYEPPYDPPRRRPSPGANPTHHPISRVRYRGEGPLDEPRSGARAERRGRSRTPRGSSTESWEYDG